VARLARHGEFTSPFESRPVRKSPCISGVFLFHMFYVYILFSNSGNRFYIWQTNNVEARIARHNAKTEAATSPYAPWEKVLVIEKPSRGEAMILEKKLKNLNSEDLRKFILKYA
jgi:putative endonuclease